MYTFCMHSHPRIHIRKRVVPAYYYMSARVLRSLRGDEFQTVLHLIVRWIHTTKYNTIYKRKFLIDSPIADALKNAMQPTFMQSNKFQFRSSVCRHTKCAFLYVLTRTRPYNNVKKFNICAGRYGAKFMVSFIPLTAA